MSPTRSHACSTTVTFVLMLSLAVGCGDEGTRPAGPFGGSGGSVGSGGNAANGGSGGFSGMGGTGAVPGTGGMLGTGGIGGAGGVAGVGGDGGSLGPCVTNALCHTCPDQFLCQTDDDCDFSGYVCVASGCETHGGAAIKQCQPSRAPSCVSDADCPNASEYDCLTVGAGTPRCIRMVEGCNAATESVDCPPGFSCEGGACVDRRLPCDSYLDCPKSHVCTSTPVSSYCVRTHRTCRDDADCLGFAAVGSFCADVDGDDQKECVGERGSSGEACVNADCGGSAPVCESGAASPAASCGEYGLCLDSNDCGAGFVCLSLWQDGRKECVPTGGTCDEVTDCPLHQVCAAPRNGGSPRCQAGKEAL
jgi:hypothetical protein